MRSLYYARLWEHWTQEGKLGKLRVLVGCEYSDTVAAAFRELGHFAYSCDLLPSEGEHGQRYHFQADVMEVLDSGFVWDLIILHPPCTALAVSGNAHYGTGMPKNQERIQAQEWTRSLWLKGLAGAPHVALENPVGVLNQGSDVMPKPSYVQPYQFGHKETKKTGLWLHNLPILTDTNNVKDETMLLPVAERQKMHWMPPSADRGKLRSLTYQGIADAMASQWSFYITFIRGLGL